jgi:hypothetical protein
MPAGSFENFETATTRSPSSCSLSVSVKNGIMILSNFEPDYDDKISQFLVAGIYEPGCSMITYEN